MPFPTLKHEIEIYCIILRKVSSPLTAIVATASKSQFMKQRDVSEAINTIEWQKFGKTMRSQLQNVTECKV